ncbi:hypothetical protein H2248_009054 [Termitomyces sp. 'cryptogamus']|nr:hypothetical protein H2248_009054 [Termitomyces sp. 'cryptogamus']
MSAAPSDRDIDIFYDIRRGKHLVSEHVWLLYYPLLLSRGYKLRSRYAPDWQPSWRDPNVSTAELLKHEDALTPAKRADIMDAVHLLDNRHVVLKKIGASSEELQIAQFLSSKNLSSDPRNHAVPILDTIYDPNDKDVAFIVMPILLQMNYLPFRRVGEFADAVRQYLTGLQFMHENNIAHRDACYFNLMMDATELIPGGFHFFRDNTQDGVKPWREWRERSFVKSLRYFFIDFGISRHYTTNIGVRDVGISAQDQSFPERSETVPYDPFKTDIYHLGNVILDIVKGYDGLDYFAQIGNAMTRKNPADRASLSDMLAMVDRLKPKQLERRVWSKDNPWFLRILIRFFGYDFRI